MSDEPEIRGHLDIEGTINKEAEAITNSLDRLTANLSRALEIPTYKTSSHSESLWEPSIASTTNGRSSPLKPPTIGAGSGQIVNGTRRRVTLWWPYIFGRR